MGSYAKDDKIPMEIDDNKGTEVPVDTDDDPQFDPNKFFGLEDFLEYQKRLASGELFDLSGWTSDYMEIVDDDCEDNSPECRAKEQREIDGALVKSDKDLWTEYWQSGMAVTPQCLDKTLKIEVTGPFNRFDGEWVTSEGFHVPGRIFGPALKVCIIFIKIFDNH